MLLLQGPDTTMNRTLKANGHTFSYIEAGSGPPLVFVHGSLLDYRYWMREVAHFASGFRAVAMSRRHHWPAVAKGLFTYKGEDQTDDVIAFIEALDVGAVHLVGHSYGGYIAARIACLRPDLLLSLTLMEPGGPVEGQAPGRSRVDDHNLGAELVRRGRAEHGVAHFLDTVCFEPKWEEGADGYKAMTLSNARTITEQVTETRPTLTASDLAAVNCPVLLMIGARSASPFPETLDRIEELIPHATRVSVADASHMINIDNKPAFLDALDAFLSAACNAALTSSRV